MKVNTASHLRRITLFALLGWRATAVAAALASQLPSAPAGYHWQPIAELSDKVPNKDLWVRAACVSSKLPMASYGYYEARVNASILSMTSSFWLQGGYSEIDVVEHCRSRVPSPARTSNL